MAHFEIGICLLRERRLEAAQSALRRAVDLSPEVKMTWKVPATVLDARGKRREREELARRFQAVHDGRL